MGDLARSILAALDARQQMPPISDGEPSFDLDAAYATSGAVMAARIERGERPAGWKIGFTNRTIWDEYGVHAPIWGAMYDNTIHAAEADGGVTTLDARRFVEPRIEPEIVFRMSAVPDGGMSDDELLGCIDAIGHGFEIVQSIFPGWRFRAVDTVAAFGLHGALAHGPLVPVETLSRREWREKLSAFGITLFRNDAEIERGIAENVLGGPLSALRHFVGGMEAKPLTRGIEAGDLITTGTVTRAFPIGSGETWSTRIDGIPLPGMRLALS